MLSRDDDQHQSPTSQNDPAKLQRPSSNVPLLPPPSPNSNSNSNSNNSTLRMLLRTLTYVAYDGFSINGGRKEAARIGKVFIELFVDETFPPPHRAEMSLKRKCSEFLVAPAASSLIWFVVQKIRTARQTSSAALLQKKRLLLWARAMWTVIHRVARQALIYRLFFRIGSLHYYLASALGIVCCFFKDSIFPDILSLHKWPLHFSTTQGLNAIFRSIVYALSFALPLHKVSKRLAHCPRRRGNVKKLIFAMALSHAQRILRFQNVVSATHI